MSACQSAELLRTDVAQGRILQLEANLTLAPREQAHALTFILKTVGGLAPRPAMAAAAAVSRPTSEKSMVWLSRSWNAPRRPRFFQGLSWRHEEGIQCLT